MIKYRMTDKDVIQAIMEWAENHHSEWDNKTFNVNLYSDPIDTYIELEEINED